MNASKKNLKLIILSIFALIPIYVKGYNVTYGGENCINGVFYNRYKSINDELTFCTQYEKNAPLAQGGCEELYNLANDEGFDEFKIGKAVRAGLGEIIIWYKTDVAVEKSSRYICTEKLLTKFMTEKLTKSKANGGSNYDLSDSSYWINACGGSAKLQGIYTNALNAYDKVNNLNKDDMVVTYAKIENTSKEIKELEFKQNGDNYEAKFSIITKTPNSKNYDNKYPITCEVSSKNASVFVTTDEQNGKYSNTALVEVPKENSGQKITVRCRPIHKFKSPVSYYACGDDEYQNLIGVGLTDSTKYGTWKEISGSFEANTGSIRILKQDSVTGEFLKGAGFTLSKKDGEYGEYKKYKYDVTDKDGIIIFDNLPPANYCVEETEFPDGYDDNKVNEECFYIGENGFQDIRFFNDKLKEPTLVIEKVNTQGIPLTPADKIKFSLYENEGCEGTPIIPTIIPGVPVSVKAGTYYLKEYETKAGYLLPSNEVSNGENCKRITIDSRITTHTFTVVNKTDCEQSFKEGMTMKERIDLYNAIQEDGGPDFNGLLDMSNTTAKDACRNIPVDKSYSTGCLSAETSSKTFEVNNVSLYTEKIGEYTFCSIDFKMNKIYKDGNKDGTTDFGIINSGQAIISSNDAVASSTLQKICFNYDSENSYKYEVSDLKYHDYVVEKSVKLGDKVLDENISLSSREDFTVEIPNSPTGEKARKVTQKITATYKLPELYAYNKDGSIYYSSDSCPEIGNCKYIGNGIISLLNHKPKENRNEELKFELKLENLGTFDEKKSTHCTYKIRNELIDYKNNVDLEFRTVKTNSYSAFLNKSGTGERKPGSNWDKEEVRKQVLVNNNDSYNKNKAVEPIYEITLTPSIIKQIRQDNKSKEYDDYNFQCKENGTLCISNYLTSLKEKKILKIDSNRKRDEFEKIK